MTQRTHRTQAEWQALIKQQALSGQSAAAFCREQGILAKSFYRWRGLLEKSTEEAFVRVEPQPAVKSSITDHMVLEYGACRLALEGCDPLWLAQLLKALS
jgi:hypothetical protein